MRICIAAVLVLMVLVSAACGDPAPAGNTGVPVPATGESFQSATGLEPTPGIPPEVGVGPFVEVSPGN